MGYSSKDGRRPFEMASKASHHHIINDAAVQALLRRIQSKPRAEQTKLDDITGRFVPPSQNPVEHVIAADGGYSEVIVEKEFPSRALHFLQVGALCFRRDDLVHIERSTFISPDDMAKLKHIERLKLALPTRNMCLKGEPTLTGSVLDVIAEFLTSNALGEKISLMDTLAWLLFRRYKAGERKESDKSWYLATNPNTGKPVTLHDSKMDPATFSFVCPETGGKIRLSDVFRLHEVINEETGATGILGYLVNVIEHLVLVHLIRNILAIQPALLGKILFIKDGPCGFFGQTANLHAPMSDLVGWLQERYDLLLMGLEKSGAFVEHAHEIREKLKPGDILLLSNEYIYHYILPGQGDVSRPYGSTTNYGHKLIFKTRRGQMQVISVPVKELVLNPKAVNLKNLDILLLNVEQLHCDMYDSALFPVALVNKLVSLSAHPSQVILRAFAKETVA